MTTKKVLKKFIKNWVEIYLPEWWGGGGGDLSVAWANALVDFKLWNFDTLFKLDSGLYKILNWLDEEDNLWLTAWDTRDDIVANSTSMSMISHSRAVMVYVANSPYAMSKILASNSATKEVSECWISISVIADNINSAVQYASSEYWSYYLNNYTVVQDAFASIWDSLIPYMSDTLFTNIILEDSTKLAELPNNQVMIDRLNQMTPDALLPAIFYYTNLSGYSTFQSLCNNSSAVSTLSSNTNAMIIVNNNTSAKSIYDSATYYNISFVANNAQMLNKAIKDSDWIAYFTSSAHNSELQAQVVNMYNTVVNNSSYFTQYTRTYADWVSSLNSSCTQSNSIVFTACGYWSSTSQKTNVFHANGVLAHSGSENYRPSSVSASNVNCVSFTNCTFTETSDWYAAIAVYRAN